MACGTCGKPDQGYGAVGYLDDYGVNAEDYGVIGMTAGLLASIIGAGATAVGVTGGLLGSRSQRKRQEEMIAAQIAAQEREFALEQKKMVERQQALFWLGLLSVGGFSAYMVYNRKKR